MAWGRRVVLLGGGLLVGAAGGFLACSSTSGAPLGHGDDYVVDVDASTLPPQPMDAAPDPVFAAVEGSTAYPGYDAAALFIVCEPTDGAAPEGGATEAKDGAAAASGADKDANDPYVDGSSYGGAGSSCTPIPAACASTPDCVCLLNALASTIPCSAPHCSVGKGFSIYCP
jgi:hypothetical protein